MDSSSRTGSGTWTVSSSSTVEIKSIIIIISEFRNILESKHNSYPEPLASQLDDLIHMELGNVSGENHLPSSVFPFIPRGSVNHYYTKLNFVRHAKFGVALIQLSGAPVRPKEGEHLMCLSVYPSVCLSVCLCVWKTSFEKNCFSAWASTLNKDLINKG